MNTLTSSILYSLFVDHQNKNWVFSPASYLEAMSSLAVCLKDQNLAELVAAAPDIDRPQAVGLDTYNCLLYSAEYRAALNEAVLDILHSRKGELRSFVGSEVVDMVNALVREKTHGKIDNLISSSDISEFTKFIILNCVLFKKAWVTPFKEDWTANEFKGAKTSTYIKYLRHWKEPHRYYEGSGYDIVELGYKESDVCCYLFVPTTTSLFELFGQIGTHLSNIADVKSNLLVDLTVPSFKIESRFDLDDATRTAGVKSVFDWNKDWSLVDFNKLDPQAVLRVDKIIQKAYIDFTKDGTEAAAATAVIISISGCCIGIPQEPPPTKVIHADKPFIYVLANRGDPRPLFVGVVNEVPDAPADTPRISIRTGNDALDMILNCSGKAFQSPSHDI